MKTHAVLRAWRVYTVMGRPTRVVPTVVVDTRLICDEETSTSCERLGISACTREQRCLCRRGRETTCVYVCACVRGRERERGLTGTVTTTTTSTTTRTTTTFSTLSTLLALRHVRPSVESELVWRGEREGTPAFACLPACQPWTPAVATPRGAGVPERPRNRTS